MSWLSRLRRAWLRTRSAVQQPRSTRDRVRRTLLSLERLEDRWVPTPISMPSATYTVTNASVSASVVGSLPYEVLQANNTSGTAITINFDAAPGHTFATHQTIALMSTLVLNSPGTFPINTASITINGPAAGVTIAGGGSGSNFSVFKVDAGTTATLNGLTITNGYVSPPFDMFFDPDVISGGGIDNYGATTLTNSTISGNTAYTGGGIGNHGTMTLSNVTLSGNFGGGGGGIFNDNQGILTIRNATFSGNSAGKGAGIQNFGTMTLTNATFSGNSAGDGGGIEQEQSGTVTLTNATLSGNSADDDGGGIYSIGTVTLQNTLVAGNTATIYPDVSAELAAASGGNLIGDGTGTFGSISNNDGNRNIVGVSNINQVLAPLGYYGGPTETMALLPGSNDPAIGNGNTGFQTTGLNGASPTDQRGFARNGAVDIGAYQTQPSYNLLVATTEDGPAPLGQFSLRGAIDQANLLAGTNTITFAASAAQPFDTPQTIALATGLTLDSTQAGASITINGPAAGLTIAGGGSGSNFSVFQVGAGTTATLNDLTIANGYSTNGGGISNTGTLTLSDTTLSANSAASGGGGIFDVASGVLTLIDCTLAGNSAFYGGGLNASAGGKVTLSNSTFSGNTGAYGAGFLCATGATMTATNLTLAGNTAGAGGGAINNGGSLTVTNATVSGNSAPNGGGIYLAANNQTTLANSIVAGNTAGIGPDIAANNFPIAGGNNLIGNAAGLAGSGISNNDANHDIVGVSNINQVLAPLGYYGGPTQTMALVPGSNDPAPGEGREAFVTPALFGSAPTDQRGFSRIVDGIVDLGAYQIQSSYNLVVTTTADGPAPLAAFSLRGAVDQANLLSATNTITFAAGAGQTFATAQTITVDATLELSNTLAPIQIQGPAEGVTIAGGGSTSNFSVLIVNVGTTATLNGLTIENGYLASSYGGAILTEGTLTITNSTLTGNTAEFGGAVENSYTGILTLSSSTVSGNYAGTGGGIDNYGALIVSNTTFSGNIAVGLGGAISNAGTASLINATQSGNFAGRGGAILNFSGATLTESSSTVNDNSAQYGGGMDNIGTLTVTDTTLSGNSATYGGGIDNDEGTLTVTDTTLSGNSATYGGGIDNKVGTATVTDTTLNGNSATYGGGIDNNVGEAITLTNTTLSGNVGLSEAGGIDNYGALTLQNTIVAGNSSATGPDVRGVVSYGSGYNLVGSAAGISGISNNDANHDIVGVSNINQVLAPLDYYGGPTQIFALLPGSNDPALGGGSTAFVTTALFGNSPTDQRGFSRLVNGAVDIGAYQTQSSYNLLVTTTADGPAPVGQFSLRSAINQANLLTGSNTISFAAAPGQTFATPQTITLGTTLELGMILPTTSFTIAAPATGVTIAGGGSGSNFSVFTVDEGMTATLNGLTITGGVSGFGGGINNFGVLTLNGDTVSGNSAANYGGGVDNFGTITLLGSTVSENSSGYEGGGIFNFGTMTLTNSPLSGNSSAIEGGGIFNFGTMTLTNSALSGNSAQIGGGVDNEATLTLGNSTVDGNFASSDGGGIENNGTLTLTGSSITGNSTTGQGGGIENASTLTVTNTTISRNSAANFGGGINNGATLTLINTTVSGNSAYAQGGIADGPFGSGVVSLTLLNSIVAGNAAASAPDIGQAIGQSISGGYNLIGNAVGLSGNGISSGSIVGVSNINQILAPLGYYGGPTETMPLLAGSNDPALGAGNTAFVTTALFGNSPTDQRGLARIANGKVDIGAAETPTSSTSLMVTTTADGPAPLGQFSLRSAINQASLSTGNSTITFAAGIGQTFATPQTITLTTGLTLSNTSAGSSIAINGPAAGVTIAGGGSGSNFSVFTVATGTTATLNGLTITAGYTSNSGGGIDNFGTLTLANDTLTGNSASGLVGLMDDLEGGGGISNENGGRLTLANDTLSGNSASGLGGAILNAGLSEDQPFLTSVLMVSNSNFSDNSASNGGAIGQYGEFTVLSNSTFSDNSASNGGAIEQSAGALTVSNSTFTANSASNSGGSIDDSAAMTVTDTTFSGNVASHGGAIANDFGSVGNALLTLTNVTISGNSASDGGGIWQDSSQQHPFLKLLNSLVAGNTAATAADLDAAGFPIYAFNNLVSNSAGLAGSGIRNGGNGNIVGVSDITQILAPLAYYGGPAETFALQPGANPALGGGNTAFVTSALFGTPPTDQRGFTRIANNKVDIGAYETEPSYNFVVTTNSDGPAPLGQLSLRAAIDQANLLPGNSTITFASGPGQAFAGPQTIALGATLELNDPNPDASITIDGPAAGLTIQGGGSGSNFSVFTVDAGTTASLNLLTIADGSLTGDSSTHGGAGVYNAGTLTLANSTIAGNFASQAGGGIANDGMLTLNDDTVSGNYAASGAGIFTSVSGTTIITNVTIVGNQTIVSIFGIETVFGFGGGLDNQGTSVITNATISGNSAGSGGGVINNNVLILQNAIVAGNAADIASDIAANDHFIVGGHDLIGSADGLDQSGLLDGNGNVVGGFDLSQVLAPLGYYGGPTQTMALLPGTNPAFDGGDADSVTTFVFGNPPTDQRGFARIVNGQVDIGAYQTEPSYDLVVSTTSDGPAAPAQFSLRAAVNQANLLDGSNTISFAAGSGQPFATPQTITLAGTLELNSAILGNPITIDGPTAGLTVAGGGSGSSFSVFQVDDGTTAFFNRLTIADGNVVGANGGGGILNLGTLTVSYSTLAGNHAEMGGAIENDLLLTLLNDTLTGNSASSGGAIDNQGSLTLANTTLSGNTADQLGGALLNGFSATVTNATISGNSAADGGGIADFAIDLGTLTLENTVVAGNSASNSPDLDANGDAVAGGSNLIGDPAGLPGSGISNGANGNIVGVPDITQVLAPLAANGGPTQTMALVPGSNPALGSGNTAFITSALFGSPPLDQRGLPRMIGGLVDMGAFETQPLPLTANPLPLATYGSAYRQTLSVTPAATLVYSTTPGALPSWLSLAANGTLTGTPTASGTFQFNVMATDSVHYYSVAVTLVVNQATLTITPSTGQSKLYGAGIPTNLAYTPSGLVNGDSASVVTGALGTIATVSSNVGTYAFSLGTLSATNYTLKLATGTTLAVTPAPLTIAPTANQSMVYGSTQVVILQYSANGLVNGDTSAVVTGTLAKSATSSSPVGNYVFTLGSLAAGANYKLQLASPSATFAVTPAPLTITPAANQSKLYGAALPATLSFTASGFVNHDPTTLLTGHLGTAATATSPAGKYLFTVGSLTAGANYTVQLAASPTFAVTPATLTITPTAGQSKVYGAPVPTNLKFTATGLVNGDTTSTALTGHLGTTATATSPPGVSYTINVGNLSAANYQLKLPLAPVTFAVTKDGTVSSIKSSSATPSFGQSVTLTATVAPVGPGTIIPGGTVTFYDGPAGSTRKLLGTGTLNSAGVATLSLTTLAKGKHTIYADFAGNSNFTLSESATPVIVTVS